MDQKQLAKRKKYLRGVPLLAEVPDAVIDTLATHMGLATFERGERIFSEGDEARTFYLVQSGWVKVLRETVSGRSVLFDIWGPGEMIGAVAIIDRKPFPATAIAASSVEMLTLSGQTFLDILSKTPEIQKAYSREINHRMREARDWQMQVASDIEGRIAQLFMRLAERMGERTGDTVVLPRLLTRQEVADMVGTTVETAIRTLSRWHKDGLVLSEEDKFIIKNIGDLAARTK